MRVDLVAGIHPTVTTPGGTRSYVLGLARALSLQGFDVSLIGAGRPVDVPFADFVPVVSQFPTTNFRFIQGIRRWLRNAVASVAPIVHGQRPDDLFPYVRKNGPWRLICTFHGDPRRGVSRRRPLGQWAYRYAENRVLPSLARLIFVSQSDLRVYSTRYPELEPRASVIPVGVDTGRFVPIDPASARRSLGLRDRPTFLFAGRFEAEKRPGVLLDAARMCRRLPQIVLAGSGSEEPRLRALAGGLDVRFLGPVDHERMPEVLSAADAVVIPSEAEGLPTVSVEALACGTPVVATRVGELPNLLVDGRTGRFFNGSPVSLSRIMEQEIEDLRGMRNRCVESARPYQWTEVAKRIAEVYRAAG